MLASIIKRDGTEVAFDSVKILNAITKANKASGEDMSPTDLLFVTEKVCRKLEAQNLRHVEEIQDVVEETLIQYDYAKTAKAYILYRAEHTKRRNAESYLMEIYKTLTYAPAIEEDIKRENANIDGDTAMGTMPLAIRCFLESEDWESCIRNVFSVVCDTDTVACIAGGIAEAFYGGTGFDEDALLRRYLIKPNEQGVFDTFLYQWATKRPQDLEDGKGGSA